jgi:hypothetical protein
MGDAGGGPGGIEEEKQALIPAFSRKREKEPVVPAANEALSRSRERVG